MRIVVVAGFADSLINFRGPLLERMRQAGHEIHACAPDASPELLQRLDTMGVVYHPIPLRRTGRNPLADMALVRHLAALFRDVRAEVVLSYTMKPVIYGSLAARKAGVPYIYSMITGLGYAFSKDGWTTRIVGAIVRKLLRRALAANRCVLFQNPDDRDLFLDLGILSSTQRQVVVNGSGVDVQAFSPAPFPDVPSFLLIARLLREKGIAEFAAAARELRRSHPTARFRLVGWLDDNPHCVAPGELDAWVAEGTLEYLGRQADVRPAISDCSIYVLPATFREGTPRTVLEAMAMGRPIITTDVPGCRETVVNGENGFLVPPGDVEALTRCMAQLAEAPELVISMGAASRRLAVEKYDVHKVNTVILDAMGLAS